MTPSLSTSRTASIWDSHSGFSILIESPVVTDISCPEQKKRVEATDSRERHFWRRDLGGPRRRGLKNRPARRKLKSSSSPDGGHKRTRGQNDEASSGPHFSRSARFGTKGKHS